MNGWIISGVALLLIAAVTAFMYITLELEKERNTPKMFPNRDVPRTVIPADWDRIMEETTLMKKGGKRR
jgi:hypothetical protein